MLAAGLVQNRADFLDILIVAVPQHRLRHIERTERGERR